MNNLKEDFENFECKNCPNFYIKITKFVKEKGGPVEFLNKYGSQDNSLDTCDCKVQQVANTNSTICDGLELISNISKVFNIFALITQQILAERENRINK